jgi:hypothetical protein
MPKEKGGSEPAARVFRNVHPLIVRDAGPNPFTALVVNSRGETVTSGRGWW